MLGYEDPVNPTFEATTAMFEKVLTEMMEQIQHRQRGKISVMVASHNEDTMRFTVNKYVIIVTVDCASHMFKLLKTCNGLSKQRITNPSLYSRPQQQQGLFQLSFVQTEQRRLG